MLISPPLWLNTEDELHDRFPFIFKVPPLTVNVPLLVNGVLFNVQPTVKSPEDTVRVPPEAMVRFFETLPDEFTVTLWLDSIETLSLHVGSIPPDHVDPEFQFPVAIEVMSGVAGF
jgi:hypothetical protein